VKQRLLRLNPRILLFTGLFAGCAYFNTFYNAQQYYREGIRLKEQGDAGQAKPKFDKAIEKSAMVISRYPKSRWVDNALFLIGRSYFEKGEYSRAVKSFEQLALVFPKSKFIPEARLFQAVALIRSGQSGSGKLLLTAIKKQYPKLRPAASYFAAIAEMEQGDEKEGLDSLLSFVSRFPNSKYYLPAVRQLADGYLNSNRYQDAIRWYEKYIELEPNPRKRVDAQVQIARCDFHQGQYPQALKTALDILGRYPDLDEELNLIIARSLDALGRNEEALATLLKVRGNNARGAEAAFLVGKYYEERGEFNRARVYYDSARLRRAESDYGILAAKRLTLLQAIAEDSARTSSPAAALFLRAEIHNLNLAEYDTAMVIYQQVADSFPQSEWAPKALLAKAWILIYVKQDPPAAAPVLNDIISRYPKTEYAVEAKKWLAQTLAPTGNR
jgi:TolA-binding protein